VIFCSDKLLFAPVVLAVDGTPFCSILQPIWLHISH